MKFYQFHVSSLQYHLIWITVLSKNQSVTCIQLTVASYQRQRNTSMKTYIDSFKSTYQACSTILSDVIKYIKDLQPETHSASWWTDAQSRHKDVPGDRIIHRLVAEKIFTPGINNHQRRAHIDVPSSSNFQKHMEEIGEASHYIFTREMFLNTLYCMSSEAKLQVPTAARSTWKSLTKYEHITVSKITQFNLWIWIPGISFIDMETLQCDLA